MGETETKIENQGSESNNERKQEVRKEALSDYVSKFVNENYDLMASVNPDDSSLRRTKIKGYLMSDIMAEIDKLKEFEGMGEAEILQLDALKNKIEKFVE